MKSDHLFLCIVTFLGSVTREHRQTYAPFVCSFCHVHSWAHTSKALALALAKLEKCSLSCVHRAGWKVGLKRIPLPGAATVLVGIVFPH